MELIDIIPEFNLYEEFWKIYTNSSILPPQYVASQAVIDRCIIGNGAEIYGEVHNCIISSGVVIGEGAVVRDSIIMRDAQIGQVPRDLQSSYSPLSAYRSFLTRKKNSP